MGIEIGSSNLNKLLGWEPEIPEKWRVVVTYNQNINGIVKTNTREHIFDTVDDADSFYNDIVEGRQVVRRLVKLTAPERIQ